MISLLAQIGAQVSAAMEAAFGEAVRGAAPLVRLAGDPKFGDYQSNVAMGLAKKLGAKPRDVAARIVEQLAASPSAGAMLDDAEVAGPGFINLRLADAFITRSLESIPAAGSEDRLGIDIVNEADRRTVVIDYSSPNVAKEMHVGHLRTTVIGDTIARVIAFQGHRVIRQNHLGDWGTQFGMVILAYWHLCMAKHRQETPADFRRLTDELGAADAAARLRLLKQRCAIHQENLRRDPDGSREFHPYLKDLRPRFEDLLPMYKYVSTVESAAKGIDDPELMITDPITGERTHLSEVSKRVAAILQGKTARPNDQELEAWRKAKAATLEECNRIYRRLGVLLCDEDACGESFYNALLPGVVEELQAVLRTTEGQEAEIRAICREDRGAVCVFFEKADGSPVFKGPTGDPLPMLIRKSDGASLYATTDLAAILYRVSHSEHHPIALRTESLRQTLGAEPYHGGLGADRVIYVVGAPQKMHFQMLFATARALGWTKKPGATVALEHVSFGSVLGEDRRMLRTRSGESVKLKDLLSEAVRRAEDQLRRTEADPEKRRGFPDDEVRRIAETVGIGAVKYADLSQNRNTDYVFNWEKMLSLQGNTAPYLMYAYARIRSIYRKGQEATPLDAQPAETPIGLQHAAERDLAFTLLRLAEVIDTCAETLLPNGLCEYLYNLAGRFMVFYESCPVLRAADDRTRASRLRLCDLTARALHIGLDLLGIGTLERM
ncbi:MAG: arginine--tRNA ligase [Phycisphaerae bacterium]